MNETPLAKPKGIKSLFRFLGELPGRLQRIKPIAGKGIKISEMPDGTLIEADASTADTGGQVCYVTRVVDEELQLWTARVSLTFIAQVEPEP
jgi:hypothetical protein